MRNFYLTLALLLTVFSYAQNKNYLSLSGGYSIPLGDFGVRGMGKEDGGADNGFSYLLQYKYEFPSKFGLTSVFYGQHIFLDHKYFSESVNSILSNYEFKLQRISTYNTMGIMVGAYSTNYITKKLFFTTTGLLGFSYSQSPYLKAQFREIGISGYSAPYYVELEKDNSISFSYSLQGAFGYDITSQLAILATFNYFATRPHFEVEALAPQRSVKESTDLKIKTFNLMLGLSYQF